MQSPIYDTHGCYSSSSTGCRARRRIRSANGPFNNEVLFSHYDIINRPTHDIHPIAGTSRNDVWVAEGITGSEPKVPRQPIGFTTAN
jgi:hypothetical protein